LFNRTGIPSAPINDVGQAINDPQVQHRQIVLPVDDASVAPLSVAGSPIKFSGFATPAVRPAAPALDQDRARILADFPEGS
jgi:CoA:oxalate CoA-transferase